MQAILFTTIILLAGLLLWLNTIAQTTENNAKPAKKAKLDNIN